MYDERTDRFGDEVDSEDDEVESSPEEPMVFHPICETGTSFPTLKEALDYDLYEHQFDIISLLACVSCDPDDMFYNAVKCVNFCRHRAAFLTATSDAGATDSGAHRAVDGEQLSEHVRRFFADQSKKELGDAAEEDLYLKPVLENDSYLLNLEDLLAMREQQRSTRVNDPGNDKRNTGDDEHLSSSSKTHAVVTATERKDENEDVHMMQMQICFLQEQLSMAKSCISAITGTKDEVGSPPAEPGPAHGPEADAATTESKHIHIERDLQKDNDTYYFAGYSDCSIHETMLRDTVRTGSYERAVLDNAAGLFEGKTVLDVGCGTGILSLFAAKAGAKKVVAVDNSRDILNLARKIARENGYSDIITFCKGKMEDFAKANVAGEESHFPLRAGEVDVIISEWMGYALLFETMLPSVIMARDVFMKKNDQSTMFPNSAEIYLEGANDTSLDFWRDVHGFDMTALRDNIAMDLTTEASVEVVPSSCIVTDRVQLVSFDLNTCTDADLDFHAPFQLTADKEMKETDSKQECKGRGKETSSGNKIDKLVISFDINFDFGCCLPTKFSTGCQSTPTHWKQCVLWLDPIVAPTLASQEIFKGEFRMSRNVINPREMDFHVLWEVVGSDGKRRCDGSIKSKLSAH